MNRSPARASFLAFALVTLAILAALPAAAEIIKAGTDYWVTPANSQTHFTFPNGDVEALCRLRPQTNWTHKVTLRGVPTQGADWDTAVARLNPAIFDPTGNAYTLVKFTHLAMASIAPIDTPCGKLSWTVRLAKTQPTTKMKITKRNRKGGVFFAKLALKVEMRATNAATGAYVGKLFYDVNLPDPKDGTGWSYGPNGRFRPGIDENDSCLDVLRHKLGNYPVGSDHYYYVSRLIANKDCGRQPG